MRGLYSSPASRMIDLSVPMGTSSVLWRLTENFRFVISLYQMQWLEPCLWILQPPFRRIFSNSLNFIVSPFLTIIIHVLTRIVKHFSGKTFKKHKKIRVN